MRAAAIGDRSFTLLWRLIGAEALEVKSEEEFLKVFRKVLRSERFSAVILPERFLDLANKVRSELQMEEKVEPLLVFVPERGLDKRAEDLRRRISLAMGIEVQV